MLFKFPVEQIARHRVCADRHCLPAAGIGLPDEAMQAVLTHEPLDYLYIVLFADDLTEQLELLVRLVHHHGAARWGRRALQMVLCKLKTLSLFALTSLSGFL